MIRNHTISLVFIDNTFFPTFYIMPDCLFPFTNVWNFHYLLKPYPISKLLVNQMLLCFGAIFSSQVCSAWQIYSHAIVKFLEGSYVFLKPCSRMIVGRPCSSLKLNIVWRLERSKIGIWPVLIMHVLLSWLLWRY